MNRSRPAIPERAEELLIDQVTEGLNASQQHELNKLLDEAADALENEFMQTAALVQLGMLAREGRTGRSTESMPADLKARIAARTAAAAAQDKSPIAARRKVVDLGSRTPVLNYAGWAMAAALALAFVVLRVDPPAGGLATPGLEQQRIALLGDADSITVAWAQPELQTYSDVTGDVVWNDAQQAGFMRLSGMPANNPNISQYQLWIVDPERGEQPVDGGVFDIPAGAGEVIIPIDSKLAVDDPAVFAITLEQPGGVVVSKGPLLVVAPVTS